LGQHEKPLLPPEIRSITYQWFDFCKNFGLKNFKFNLMLQRLRCSRQERFYIEEK
jgi:hypothetical protein